jgi:hypothetical protein
MSMLKLDGVVHWSIPVNNLKEAENFTATCWEWSS